MVPYSALTDYDRSVVLTDPIPSCGGIVGLLIIPHNFVFAMVSLWHPGDGRDVRKKPLPYNYFFISLF